MARYGGVTTGRVAFAVSALLMVATNAVVAAAQTVPFSDTEDASIGSVSVGGGRWHPVARLNLRNGDYARGNYDDDASDLDRLPVHAELGLVYDLHHDAGGSADWWLEAHSSNGFHASAQTERTSPRSWYESNNLVGLVAAPATGLRTALTYTIKASPNGVSDTTHEASLALAYEADRGLGWLHPSAAATIRPRGGGGAYTQVGIEPEFDLAKADAAPSIGIPVIVGVGWGGFYEPGSGRLAYGSAGVAYTHPLRVGQTRMALRAEIAALVRQRGLARLDGPDANRATVVPIGQLALTAAY